MMPEDGLETLKSFDAILFGAICDARGPDEVTVWEQSMPILKQFWQYVNFRRGDVGEFCCLGFE